ncbi:hypothetical protein M3Y99_01690600 [Aphelenchoides fujianensis]|nr:hypothetical protein M3Y99_01690600 [Aphelenchoides fujianensis]
MTRVFLLVFLFVSAVVGQMPYYMQPGGHYHYAQPQQQAFPQMMPYGGGQRGGFMNQQFGGANGGWPFQQQPAGQGASFYPQQQQPGMGGEFPHTHSPEEQKFFADVQKCLENEGPEYFNAFLSISHNFKLTKAEIAEHRDKLIKRLEDETQSCFKKLDKAEKKRVKEEAREQNKVVNRLSPQARSLFKEYKKIQDNQQLTLPAACQQTRQLLQRQPPNVLNELAAAIPAFRQYASFSNYPQPSYNNPYGHYYPMMQG